MTDNEYQAAVDTVWGALLELAGPKDAIRVLCATHVLLLKANGTSPHTVRRAVEEAAEATIDVFLKEHGIPPTQ